MNLRLNKETVHILKHGISVPGPLPGITPAIVHFGIGGFHRSHQAYALQQLIQLSEELYGRWQICGVCIRPNDATLVENMRQQDLYYTLKMSGPSGEDDVRVINVIKELLLGPAQEQEIIDRIARPETKVVSFTITEGGYNIDESTGVFNLDHPDILSDLLGEQALRTVFGYLGKALQRRKEQQLGKLVLLSCDNIQENGQVLRQAFEAYLQQLDPALLEYARHQLVYPSSMVDRITPVTSQVEKDRLEERYGYKDECLVVSEKFFQWVIENKELGDFPPLDRVGVAFVEDVKPYERMKLSILNGGHSLVGLIGWALGYDFIHEALNDTEIAYLFNLYNTHEVIPTLDDLPGVDYPAYVAQVKSRFGNELIRDSIFRIISGSTAKIPKFILPVILKQLAAQKQPVIGALILAAWWHYLYTEMNRNELKDVDDEGKEEWIGLFRSSATGMSDAFLHRRDVFGEIGENDVFTEHFKDFAGIIKTKGMRQACALAIHQYKKTIHHYSI